MTICMGCGGTPAGPVVWATAAAQARLCVACGIATTTPEPAYEDRLTTLEDQHGEAFYAAPAAFRARWLAGLLPPGARVLEVGCGAGAQLQAFRASGFNVGGIEAMPTRAARAADAGLDVQPRFFEQCAPRPVWDGVYHTDLLSHVADPVDFLRQMRPWLARPDGLVAFEVGAFDDAPESWSRWLRSPGLHVHRRFYTLQGLSRLLDRAGLRCVACRDFDLGAYTAWIRAVGAARAALGRAPTQGAARDGALESAAPQSLGRARRANERFAAWLRYGPASRVPTGAPRTLLVAARFNEGVSRAET